MRPEPLSPLPPATAVTTTTPATTSGAGASGGSLPYSPVVPAGYQPTRLDTFTQAIIAAHVGRQGTSMSASAIREVVKLAQRTIETVDEVATRG